MNKQFIFNSRKLEKTNILLLHLFLGWSYGSMNQMGKQILFYLTCGGCCIWGLYRLFTIDKAVKEYNRNIALEIGLSQEEMLMLGLF